MYHVQYVGKHIKGFLWYIHLVWIYCDGDQVGKWVPSWNFVIICTVIIIVIIVIVTCLFTVNLQLTYIITYSLKFIICASWPAEC